MGIYQYTVSPWALSFARNLLVWRLASRDSTLGASMPKPAAMSITCWGMFRVERYTSSRLPHVWTPLYISTPVGSRWPRGIQFEQWRLASKEIVFNYMKIIDEVQGSGFGHRHRNAPEPWTLLGADFKHFDQYRCGRFSVGDNLPADLHLH